MRRSETPEDALWRNVIAQAILMRPSALPSYGGLRDQMEHNSRAKRARWVQNKARISTRVCSLAGLEADRVHAFAMAQIRKAIDEAARANRSRKTF